MTSKKIQLYTDRANTIEASPETSANCVILSDGNDLQKVLDNDLTNPTVVHEETSFKVGAGDIDVSSSVVDGEVGRMVIKGKTYQNILPEPSTHVLTNNKEMFKVNEGLDPNVEIVDGVSKSAILSGQTKLMDELGNECDHPNRPNAVRGAYINASTGEETLSDTSCRTTYIKAPHETFKIRGKNRWKKLAFYDVSKQLIKTLDPALNSYDDYVVNGTLIPSNAEYMRVSGSLSPINSSDVLEPVLEILDANNSSLYNTQLRSCKLPVLTTTGKNLLDVSGLKQENAYIDNTDGNIKSSNGHIAFLDYIAIPNSGNILFFNNSAYSGVYLKLAFYDINKTYISGATLNTGFIKTSIPNNAKYCRVSAFNHSNGFDLQLEVGDVKTSYEPYKTNILSCELTPMNQSMFEQGTFAESTTPNTRPYEGIKINSGNLYDTRIRTKGTYKVAQGATYEVQLNDGYGIFVCFCKNGLYSATINRWLDGTRTTFTVPNDCDEMFFALRKTDNSAITPSDYSRIGLKIHQEVVLRSLPNGVCDTLNLNTGEYVQRIGEIVLDGTQNWTLKTGNWEFENTFGFTTTISDMINTTQSHPAHSNGNSLVCSHFPSYGGNSLSNNALPNDIEMVGIDLNRVLGLRITKTKLSTPNAEGLKAWLQANPVTVQYELQTPIVKTVDLSTSGNWEKVVLDGSENWESRNGGTKYSYTITNIFDSEGADGFCDTFKFIARGSSNNQQEECVTSANTNNSLSLFTNNESLSSVGKLKTYLQSNPITVWYQTATHQDSTQVKQPIFFKDGHIQLSSGADNSLIPTLDYQAKTSNSYVMDLMKTNTRYTMKAKSASGTFTIDGTSYGAGTNGTFTSPTSMTNKFLVMSNKTHEEVMILEGDVTSKAIPYFKGIKSAFEDESKIEVLSTGKNLIKKEEFKEYILKYHPHSTFYVEDGVEYCKTVNSLFHNKPFMKGQFKKGTRYTMTLKAELKQENKGLYLAFRYTDDTYSSDYTSSTNPTVLTVTSSKDKVVDYVYLSYSNGGDVVLDLDSFQLTETDSRVEYEPYKSNSTKIPLLSPLRSLPNGVCDELIVDRMKKKATLIKRLDCITFDGSSDENWHTWGSTNSTSHLNNYHYVDGTNNTKNLKVKVDPSWIVSRLGYGGGYSSKKTGATLNSSYFAFSIPKNLIGAGSGDTNSMYEKSGRAWLSQNPITVYYELATPVVTEIDLENFPLIYKDGHIFLNSEIAPVVEIDYNINQSQQIQSNNETLQRHELDILDLDNLIVSFVNAEYNLRLLKFDMELSMMALAE